MHYAEVLNKIINATYIVDRVIGSVIVLKVDYMAWTMDMRY